MNYELRVTNYGESGGKWIHRGKAGEKIWRNIEELGRNWGDNTEIIGR
jgi:hypothetical protein